MRRFQSLYSVVLLALLSSLTLVGCRDALFDRSFPDCTEQQEAEVTPGTLEGAVTMTLAYESHALKTPGTLRAALSVEQESELKLATTRVLIFNSNGEYQYDAPLTKITPDASDHQKGTLTVQIKPGQGLGIVVLANLTEAEKTRKVSGTKADILKTFAYSVAQATDFSSVGIPMFGEVTQVEVKTDTQPVPTLGKTIHLLRAVARVDVGLKMSAAGTTGKDGDFDETASGLISTIVEPSDRSSKKVKWTLLETKFFNAASQGLVVPAEGNYSLDGDKPKATAPTLPQTPGKQTLTYAVTDNLLKRNIYVPEVGNPEPEVTQNGTETDPTKDNTYYLNRPYLILKLQYDEVDDTGNLKTGGANGTTYFRVDFLKREGEEATAKYTYLPLLRNHRYKVDIQNIGGLGFDNEEDAKKGPSANIMYNVLVWNESQMSNVKYDGQYMLGVSNDKLTFYKDGGTYSIKVQTSWPKGFEVKELPGWLEVESIKPTDASAGKDTDEKLVTFKIKEPASVTEPREGKAYIQAGRMRWNLDVIQLNTLDLKIEIFADAECTKELQYIELDERGKDTPDNEYTVGKKKFYVKVTPAARISAVDDETKTPFTFSGAAAANSSRPPIESAKEISAGVFEFEVTADPLNNPNDPFESRQNKYRFITEQSGERAEAMLSINQTEYNIVFYEDEALTNPMLDDGNSATYFMDGADNTFYVRSNIPYVIWMDNQMIDESARSDENANADGSSKFPIVAGYYDKGGKFVGLTTSYDATNQMNNWRNVKNEESPTPNGSPLKFKAGEKDALKIIYGHVMWVASTPMKSLEWKFPLYDKQTANHDQVTKVQTSFIAGYLLPEANSYPVTLGETGLLIPIGRRINHAARYYDDNLDTPYGWIDDDYQDARDETAKIDPYENWDSYKRRNQLNRLDPQDKISLEVLWTDIQSVTEAPRNRRNPIKKDGSAPLKLLAPVKIKGERYAFVLPGNDAKNNYGNLVFCVRDKDKKRVDNKRDSLLDPAEAGKDVILWSFHLMLYRRGELPSDRGDQEHINRRTITYLRKDYAPDSKNYKADWTYDVKVWPYALGAFDLPQEWLGIPLVSVQNDQNIRDLNYRTVGMYYQFGRKDPFPRYINAIGRPTRFIGHNGKEVEFKFLKSTTISMRESIEYPMVLVGNTQGHQWLTEGGKTVDTNISLAGTSAFGTYGLWGGGSPVGNESTSDQRTNIMRVVTKTVFDPCPYGFRIPIPGYSSTKMFQRKIGATPEKNLSRMRMNNAVFMVDGGKTQIYNTYNGSFETLFAVWDGIVLSGTGENPIAVATSYLAQAHYPVFMFTFGTGAPQERYQIDIHRSAPIGVRPFNNVQEADWEQYVRR